MAEKSNRNFLIGLGIVVLIIIIVWAISWYAREDPIKEALDQIKGAIDLPKCRNYDIQKKIADDINEKLKELDLCDCKLDEISEPEKFGNINFY